MSQNEDIIEESQNSSESSSEESVFEDETTCSTHQSHSSDEEDIVPYANDPLADPAWTAEYEKEMKEDEELEKALKDRLTGRVGVNTW